MPHVIVKMYNGRTHAQKERLTQALVKEVMAVTQCPDSAVSVAIEEYDPADWAEKVYTPDIVGKKTTLYKEPGYDPYEK